MDFFPTFLNIRIRPLPPEPAAQSSSKQKAWRNTRLGGSRPWKVSGLALWLPAEPFKVQCHLQPRWAVLVLPAWAAARPRLLCPWLRSRSCPSPLRQPLRAATQRSPFKWPRKGLFSKLYLGNISRLAVRNHSAETDDELAKQNEAFLCGPGRLRTGSHLILFCSALSTSPRLQKHLVNQKGKLCSLVITEKCLS